MFNQRLTQSQLPPNIVYLASDYPKHTSCAAHIPEQFSDTRITLKAYRQRAKRMVEIAATRYQQAKDSGLDDVAAWNASSVDWTNGAKVSQVVFTHVFWLMWSISENSSVIDESECITVSVHIILICGYSIIIKSLYMFNAYMQAHCHFVVLRLFSEVVQNADVCPANLTILNALCSLYAVYGIVQCSGEFSLVSDWQNNIIITLHVYAQQVYNYV